MSDKKPKKACIGYCLLLRKEVPLALIDGKIVCFLGSEDGTPGQTTEDGVLITEDEVYLPREVSEEEWEWISRQQDKFRKEQEKLRQALKANK